MDNNLFFHTDQMDVGYDGKPLIKNVEIRLKKGEILTLIGPNGAGKSTILKSITKQLPLIGGTTYLDNIDMARLSGKEIARRLSVVLTTRISPELMTCYDVVATGRYPYTGTLGLLGKEDKQKVTEALKLVHAEELTDREFAAISDGQRQRILLARALCQEPELLILDEPTSFLDIRHKLEFLTILKNMVKERGLSVILSLHELDLAQKISDRIMCVKGDHIYGYGRPEELFASDYICRLYDMSEGSYDTAFGCMELPPSPGTPKTFVIAGGGSGINTFRALQRAGIPFITGILHEGDIDYQAALHLSNGIIREKAFEPISEETYKKALSAMEECHTVISALTATGTLNARNRDLIAAAQKAGKIK